MNHTSWRAHESEVRISAGRENAGLADRSRDNVEDGLEPMTMPTIILAVDETPEPRGLLVNTLRGAGIQVRESHSGDEVLASVAAQRPDLILLDVAFRGLDGLETYRRLKGREDTRHIPVILAGAFSDGEDWEASLSLGAADYISKPFQTQEVLMRIRTQLTLMGARALLEEQAAELRLVNERLQSEITERQRMEASLRQVVERGERSRRTLLSAAEDQRQSAAALRLGEARFRLLIEKSLIGMYVSRDCMLLYANPRLEEILGYGPGELVGSRIDDLVLSEDFEILQRAREELRSGALTSIHSWRVKRKDGAIVELGLQSLVADYDGAPAVIGMAQDITERERMKVALQESEEHFRSVTETAPDAIITTDASGIITYCNPAVDDIFGYSAGELVGRQIEVLMPMRFHQDHLAVMRRTAQTGECPVAGRSGEVHGLRKSGEEFPLEISISALRLRGELAFTGILRDVTERSRARSEIAQYVTRLERSTEETLQAVALVVERRDPYTAGHERRVGELAGAIGREMGLPDNTVKGLRLTGYVHDIGKISVPAELLAKPGRLSPIEFELIKDHAQVGHDMLKGIDFPWPLADVILQHHERMDGSGYPRMLKGDEIVLEARVMAVADVIEAMSSHRPYRPGLGLEAALEEIAMNAGKLYDTQVVAACLRMFRDKGHTLPA